ncbi:MULTISPECIES: magnesium transporter MgtE N-terminal domain-containing protein [Alphaproteobacteria]|jgi:CBS domain-containing protein|uniref:Magnesium transporter n=3 Tax=Pseudomonadota TaxID=1224 RepID=A0A927EEK3_9HYPH|nr:MULTISPECIES: CBS domain-containing protein [Alphaproteobacteria]ENZ78106.1 hypothetical protein OR37_04078 [Caulobacter vibrioides OR37]MBD3848660.1 magnesium transporter [Bosea spartocytisi]MBN9255370.1 magnesium transporter [Mesorhizobium sp.]MCT4471692.1 CBS domain-containing protein [Bosea spartocytisi]MDR7259322.1 CBS domain-containing protein [Sphingomonas sp. BE270]
MTPNATDAPHAPVHETVSLVSMFKHGVVDANGAPAGRLEDVVAVLRDNDYPLLKGLLVGSGPVFVPMADVIEIKPDGAVRIAAGERRPFSQEAGETLLKAEMLGRRLVDLPRGVLVKAHDVRFDATPSGWRMVSVDVHKHSWLHFGSHEHHPARDWHDFLPLTRDAAQARSTSSLGRIEALKPAQIADIIERAPSQEQDVLLALVHTDPSLEANVFEELDDDKQAQLLKSRNDDEVADVLSRMRADDAADAIMELPQERRQNVLDRLPTATKMKVSMLLGFNSATAGGLMGADFLAVPEDRTIGDALEQLRTLTTVQPEALVTIHSLNADGALAGTLSVVRALQLSPSTLLRDAVDARAIVASPDDDIIAVTTRMADFNLLSLPVVDAEGKLLGLVTVDDALEAAIPQDWARREGASGSPQRRLG